jgi:hypothetical protein
MEYKMKRDKTIPNNKPHTIILNNENKSVIKMAISRDRNVINEEAEKFLKYNDPAIEVQRT